MFCARRGAKVTLLPYLASMPDQVRCCSALAAEHNFGGSGCLGAYGNPGGWFEIGEIKRSSWSPVSGMASASFDCGLDLDLTRPWGGQRVRFPMKNAIVWARRTTTRKAALALAVTALSAGAIGVALAQQPAAPAAPAAPAKPPAKPAAKPAAAAPKAGAPAAAQAAPAAGAPAGQQAAGGPAPEMPQLIYSPWAKFCGKGQDTAAKQVCFTGKDARTEAGQPVIAAALIEPDGEPKKLFRITLPSPLQLQYGTRVIVDQQAPLTGPFFTCFANGCMADYEATPDLIGKLKHGQMLTIQAINLAGAAISFPLPLVDFAKANEGPPTDPKVFEEQQKKLQEELQKRADEARKKLEASGGAAPAAPAH
jgi:invasion protein IalB